MSSNDFDTMTGHSLTLVMLKICAIRGLFSKQSRLHNSVCVHYELTLAAPDIYHSTSGNMDCSHGKSVPHNALCHMKSSSAFKTIAAM